MLHPNQLRAAFQAKSDAFADYEQELQNEAAFYAEKLTEFAQQDYHHIQTVLAQISDPGAWPAAEFENREGSANRLVIPFNQHWTNHQAAQAWAYQTLLGHATFAADGAQIMPNKELTAPIAAIQVAWFENYHTTDGQYSKNAKLEVLTPTDLLMGRGAEKQVSDQMVNLRRFQLEIEVLCEFMHRYAATQPTRPHPPVVFMDGSIVISFAERWHIDQRQLFIKPIIELLDVAQATGIPVIGYIEPTYACDLAVMLKQFFHLNIKHSPVHDAYFFRDMRWGDRTIFFTCAREGLLAQFGRHKEGIGFLYLKTHQQLPARLDIPVWVYEQGLLDYVIDIVRAEVVVGAGYPYPLATASATAALSAQDRTTFYTVFQQFNPQLKKEA